MGGAWPLATYIPFASQATPMNMNENPKPHGPHHDGRPVGLAPP